jgi:hypothetical protein
VLNVVSAGWPVLSRDMKTPSFPRNITSFTKDKKSKKMAINLVLQISLANEECCTAVSKHKGVTLGLGLYD